MPCRTATRSWWKATPSSHICHTSGKPIRCLWTAEQDWISRQKSMIFKLWETIRNLSTASKSPPTTRRTHFYILLKSSTTEKHISKSVPADAKPSVSTATSICPSNCCNRGRIFAASATLHREFQLMPKFFVAASGWGCDVPVRWRRWAEIFDSRGGKTRFFDWFGHGEAPPCGSGGAKLRCVVVKLWLFAFVSLVSLYLLWQFGELPGWRRWPCGCV